ncbi:MAG: methionyl-tRNA formyltransferase [Cellvibrionaceae bacterium]
MQDSSSLRIVFAGTPAFAADYLSALLASQHQVVAVYTQPDRPAGRGKKLTASPVKQLATTHELPVWQPVSLRGSEEQAQIISLNADVMVVVAYGLILPQPVLDAPGLGCLNVHASLLPRWRGAAPIQRAIEAGDTETGITIMQMDAGLDTGPMLATARCEIKTTDTAGTLLERLAQLGKQPLLSVLEQLSLRTATYTPQNESQASYASKIDKREAEINWRHGAAGIDRKIRAFNPLPGAFTHYQGQRIRILRAAPLPPSGDNDEREHDELATGTVAAAQGADLVVRCGDGQLRLIEIQLPGKKSMPVDDVLRGNKDLFVPGQRFH